MKKIFAIIFAFFVVQCAFAQKMQIHTSTMGTIEVQLSNVDSITFTNTASEPGGLMANPNYLSLLKNQQITSTIGGGTTPYSILTPPNPTVASASISGSLLTVTGVGGGNTYVSVKDNSNPYKTATVEVRVSEVFTSAGSLSFTSTAGNFSASGIFDGGDSIPSNTQGAGGYFSSQDLGPFAALQVVGYVQNSSTNWDVAVVMYMDSTNVITGTHPFLTGSGPIKRAEFMYIKGWNPSDTTGDNPFNNGSYMLVTGNASLSSFTGTSAQGTFSGTGTWFTQDNISDPTKPITLTNGTFNVPVINGSILSSSDRKAIEKLIRRLNR
jgi:hypothetical protein